MAMEADDDVLSLERYVSQTKEERAEIGPMVEIGLPYLAAIVSAVEWIEALAYDCESSDVVNEAAKDHILALKQRRGEVEIELSPVVREAIFAVRMAVDEAIGVE